MRIQGHVALGICASAVKLAVTGNRNGLWPFLLANLLIDVDHVPSYLRVGASRIRWTTFNLAYLEGSLLESARVSH